MSSSSRRELLHSFTPVNGGGRSLPAAEMPFEGMAVAALAVAFVPLYITNLLAIIFGLVALSRISDTGKRGKSFAIVAIIVGVLVPLFVTGVGVAAANTYTQQYLPVSMSLRQTYDDVKATSQSIYDTIQTNPNMDARDVPKTTHENEVITVTYVNAGTWTVRGYSTLYGNPDRDYVEWLSWQKGFNLHGSYQSYSGAMGDCGCEEGANP